MAQLPSGLTIEIRADMHGAFEDTRIAMWRRVIALWLLEVVCRLLRTRVSLEFRTGA